MAEKHRGQNIGQIIGRLIGLVPKEETPDKKAQKDEPVQPQDEASGQPRIEAKECQPFLQSGGVYPAQCRSIDDDTSAHSAHPFVNRWGDPFIKILDPEKDPEQNLYYYGFVRTSSNISIIVREMENARRQLMIENGKSASQMNVKIVKLPGNPKGPYIASCTLEPAYDPRPGHGALTAEEALAIVTSNNIFYGQCIGMGRKEDPFLRVFFPSREPEVGYFSDDQELICLMADETSEFNKKIPEDARKRMVAAMEIAEKLKQYVGIGGRVLVKKIGEDCRTRTLFFKPAIRFLPTDDAWTGRKKSDRIVPAEQLITRIEGYMRGERIFDLPLVGKREDEKGELVGQAYVLRPFHEWSRGVYRKINVKGIEENTAYAREAVVRHNDGKKLVAVMVA